MTIANELIFLLHSAIVSCAALLALKIGRDALIAFICVQGILANLFVIKQITLFGLTATGSDAYTIGAVLGLNLLQEYFGKATTKKTIWLSFFLLVFYAIACLIQISYLPTAYDTTQLHYLALLSFMPRITAASLITFLIVQHIDCTLYGFLKIHLSGRYLVIRNYLSLLSTQFLDTILFSFLGLYGIVQNIWHIIFISYVIKLISIFIATPFVRLSKKIMNDL